MKMASMLHDGQIIAARTDFPFFSLRGRRTLYISGLAGLTIALFTIGILGCFENDAPKDS